MTREDRVAMAHRALQLAAEQLGFALEYLQQAGLNVTAALVRNAAEDTSRAWH